MAWHEGCGIGKITLILIAAVVAVAFAGSTGTGNPDDKQTGENVTEKTVYAAGIDGEYSPYLMKTVKKIDL